MSYHSLDHHEVEVARLGRVRLPRVRAVASFAAVGVLVSGAAVPVVADSRPQVVPATEAAQVCPPWLCASGGDGGGEREHESVQPPTPGETPAGVEPRTRDDAPAAISEPSVDSGAEADHATAVAAPAERAPRGVADAIAAAPTATSPAPEVQPVPAQPAPVIAAEPAPEVPAEPAPAAPREEAEPVPAEPAPEVPAEEAESVPAEPAPGDVPAASTPADEASPAPPEQASPAAERGSSVGFRAYTPWGGPGYTMTFNSERTRDTWKAGIGTWDFGIEIAPDVAMPPNGLMAGVSGSVAAPGAAAGAGVRAVVDSNGVTTTTTLSRVPGIAAYTVGPDGQTQSGPRAGGSISGRPVTASAEIGVTTERDSTPSLPPGAYDSDGDGFKDGNMAESPEVGGRWGQSPTLDGNDVNNNGVRDEYENSGQSPVDTPDGDGDGFSDGSFAESPEAGGRETHADYGAGGPADSDGDGFSDGSFAESPEAGGRETHADYGAGGPPDSDGDGFSDGSFAESPEMGGRETQSEYGGADPASDGGDGGAESGDADSGAESGDADTGAGAGGNDSDGDADADTGAEAGGTDADTDADSGGGYSEAGDPGDTGIA